MFENLFENFKNKKKVDNPMPDKLNDAIRAWNLIPDTMKNCETIWSAKKSIKQFVRTLPL